MTVRGDGHVRPGCARPGVAAHLGHHSPGDFIRSVSFAALALLPAAIACHQSEQPYTPFSPIGPRLLSVASPGKDEDPSVLLAHDGTIFVAWFSDRTASGDIYISSTKNGRDWTTPVRVTTDAGGDFYPNLVQDDAGLFHLTWFRWTAPQVGHIMYNTSPDGLTWNAANETQATKAPDVDDWVPTIAVRSDGTVLIYFVSKKRSITTTQQNDIYLARKQPGAAAFDVVVGAIGINVPDAHDHLPFIAKTGAAYTIVWTRYDLSQEVPWVNPKSDLWYATSSDGINWGTPAKYTTDAGNVVHLYVSMYETLSHEWSLLWLSTRSGSVQPFEAPVSGLGSYPSGVTPSSALTAQAYSHRISATPIAGTYIGVWVQGPEGAQDIYYRIFER